MFVFLDCCTHTNNSCPKKETCERYLNANENNSTDLFNRACTRKNNYSLYEESEESDEED